MIQGNACFKESSRSQESALQKESVCITMVCFFRSGNRLKLSHLLGKPQHPPGVFCPGYLSPYWVPDKEECHNSWITAQYFWEVRLHKAEAQTQPAHEPLQSHSPCHDHSDIAGTQDHNLPSDHFILKIDIGLGNACCPHACRTFSRNADSSPGSFPRSPLPASRLLPVSLQ